ncbi:MAG: hypothetical protein MUP19_02920, partial [Candidatus Aminicenantes bacterium]|nr:hypothetical protein [Candidatus Aminicenantes bacterium]
MKKSLAWLILGTLLALAPAAGAQTNPVKARPAPVQPEPAKGHLIIIGGGDRLQPILKSFIALADRFQSGKIVIYLMASGVPMEDGPATLADFQKLGAKSVVWVNLTRDQAMVQDNADALNDVGGVYFEGGDQSRLTAALLDTPIHAKIMDLYRRG